VHSSLDIAFPQTTLSSASFGKLVGAAVRMDLHLPHSRMGLTLDAVASAFFTSGCSSCAPGIVNSASSLFTECAAFASERLDNSDSNTLFSTRVHARHLNSVSISKIAHAIASAMQVLSQLAWAVSLELRARMHRHQTLGNFFHKRSVRHHHN
jgi:hypothetical protein